MQTLIVSDIFGRTEALETLASKVDALAEIIAPYGSKMMGFSDEAEAYEYFSNKVGLDRYSQMLKEHICASNSPLRLVGFSVGAAAIWNISASNTTERVVEATCFYGSQIRSNVAIKPRFPIKLIFPASELHFSIPELIEALSDSEKVTIDRTTFLHGFMNTHSKNYDQNGYNYGLREIRNSTL